MERLVPYMQKGKLALHITQAVFIFVAWVIEIVYFRTALITGADMGWYFALCFLSIPAIIYQTMTPLFPRSRKWGHPYAFAAVDVVYTILWLSAFAAVASWNSGGWCIQACGLSEAMVGLGFMIFLLFVLTSAISVYGVIYFRQHGALPGAQSSHNTALIDPDREAFSAAANDEYGSVHTSDKDDSHSMSGAELPTEQRYNAPSYGGGYVPPHVSEETTSFSNTSYGGAAGSDRVQFPAANYS